MNLIITYVMSVLMIFTNSDAIIDSLKTNNITDSIEYHYQKDKVSRNVKPGVSTKPIDPVEIREKSTVALKHLREYWENVFIKNRLSYRSPRVILTSETGAYYNQIEHTIYLNLPFLIELTSKVNEKIHTDGDLAYISVLAHEFAHGMQSILNIRSASTKEHELQADCLTGTFIGHLRDLNLLEDGDLDEATTMFLFARDPTGTDPRHQHAHGTGTERVSSFHKGLTGGVSACKCGLR